ncbi:MAG: hypothetical protein IRZ26_07960 [Clostridia bacterium]|nr:hypothetical protein [Clostridia bacterium]
MAAAESGRVLLPWEEESDAGEEPGKPTQAQVLIQLAQAAELWHSPDGEAYATFGAGGHRESWPVRSKGFKSWLVSRFFEAEGKPPSAQAMQDALGYLEAVGLFRGPEYPVFVRVAEAGGAVYLDLGDPEWRAVEVTPGGWRVVQDPPVRFRRARGMLALPLPVAGGSIEELRPFVNAEDEATWRLFVSWLVGALHPSGPYPVLILQGEQGSAKSTMSRVARALIDPSAAPVRTVPRDERDLAIAAKNGWVIALDNLSGTQAWLSDALARLATGAGLSTRQLYTDDEEIVFSASRPIIANGIDEVATRGDLLDRAVVLDLPPIPDGERRPEADFWRAFEEARPRILGALLDAVAMALRRRDEVRFDRLPRMADFALWAAAAAPAFGWSAGEAMVVYLGNRADAVALALEDDPVAQAVLRLLEGEPTWEGTATDLLERLNRLGPERVTQSPRWPRSAKALSNRLRRAAPLLRRQGVEVEFFREAHTGRRMVRLEDTGEETSPSSPEAPESPESRIAQGVSGVTQPGEPCVTHRHRIVTLNGRGDASADDGDDADEAPSPANPAPGADSDDGDDGDAPMQVLSTAPLDRLLAAVDDWADGRRTVLAFRDQLGLLSEEQVWALEERARRLAVRRESSDLIALRKSLEQAAQAMGGAA